MEIYYIACFMVVTIAQIETQKIESKITEYFASDSIQQLNNDWGKYKKPLENAILRAIKENYGYKAMNVYVRRMQDPYKVSKGYYHSDNQVQIILIDLELDDLPYLWMPEVTFSLPSNILKIGASLSKMIIRSNYVAFRNNSDIIYDVKDQNFYENSPFRFQQVHNMGQLGITIEGCVITGLAVATLSGTSVNLGFNSFKLAKCQYTFEISTPGSGSPPVVAKYYPMGNGLNIEDLLLKSLKQELMPKLQAAMFSYINTSAILGDQLPALRQEQEDLFHNTSLYINDVVRNLNRISLEKNSGVVDMEDFKLKWNDLSESKSGSEIYLTKMVMSGLETAYSSHIGGPYKEIYAHIGEEMRFSIIRVRGNISYESDRKYEYSFVAEIEDVAVEILHKVNILQQRKQLVQLTPDKYQHRFYVSGWRRLELTIPRVHFMYADALVTGFLLNSVPKYIMDHLNENFDKALEQATNDKVGKLELGLIPKADQEEILNESNDTGASDGAGKKSLYAMTGDEEGYVHVEPQSAEKDPAQAGNHTIESLIHIYNDSILIKNNTKHDLIQVYDSDHPKRLIGNEDEMIIISEETLSNESTQDSLDQSTSNRKREASRTSAVFLNEIGSN